MYEAKAGGRDASRLYQPGTRDAGKELGLAVRLRRAIDDDELSSTTSLSWTSVRQMTGVEALVRWNDPTRGLIAPVEFIPLAERTGLIRPLSEWVLGEATRQAAAWRAAGHDHSISINIPPDTCRQIGPAAIGRLIRLRAATLAHHARDDGVADDGPRRGETDDMEALRALGIRLAIDDFGTGHSSLRGSGELPVSISRSTAPSSGPAGGRHRANARHRDHAPRGGTGPRRDRRRRRDRGPARLPAGDRLPLRPEIPVLAASRAG